MKIKGIEEMEKNRKKEGNMTGRSHLIIVSLLLIVAAAFLLSGCSSGHKEAGAESAITPPTRVGSESCTNTCHASTVDITGTPIAQAWAATTHRTVEGVQCEDCHGGGSLHWGVGPIPFSRPQAAQCLTCHNGSKAEDKSSFLQTAHANQHIQGGPAGPDVFFFQGDAGTGQASTRGQLEFFPDGVTPVSKAQHIQECSMCHNPNQRFVYDATTGALLKPDPNTIFDPNNIQTWQGLQNPEVSCASCHDAHQPQQMVLVPQRGDLEGYPVFRKFIVNPTGEQNFGVDLFTGNESPNPGASSVAGFIYQPNGAVQPDGSVNPAKVQGTNNEIKVEILCAACHTKSKYLFSQMPTHQENVYPQWQNSGHGTRNDPAFAEFSANPPAYTNPNTGIPYEVGSHQSSYPIDMALSKFGATANTTQNAGNNNFSCFRCHNGIGTIVWQEDAQGTPDADIVFGDEPVTCISCHDTHQNFPPQTTNVRIPVAMTQYSTSSITIKGQVFLDNQPVPLDKTVVENGTVCIYCHQGRESGLTLYATKLAPGKNITGNFFNPHYLGTAGMLWGHNAYEFAGKSYSFNEAHQGANCPTCHMANPTADNRNGGHTWWPNFVTCNVAACHGGANLGPLAADVNSENGPASPDVDNYRAIFDTNNYTGTPGGASLSIAQSIRVLEDKIIAVLAANGVEYDDLNYPYFFQAGKPHTSDNTFKAWTPQLYKAAFNLSYVIKGLPSAATSQIGQPNASAAVHDYKYIIQILQDSYENLTGSPIPGAFRPVGTRPAVVYGPNQ